MSLKEKVFFFFQLQLCQPLLRKSNRWFELKPALQLDCLCKKWWSAYRLFAEFSLCLNVRTWAKGWPTCLWDVGQFGPSTIAMMNSYRLLMVFESVRCLDLLLILPDCCCCCCCCCGCCCCCCCCFCCFCKISHVRTWLQDTTAYALTGRVSVTTNRSLSGTQSFLNRDLATVER